MNILNTQQMAPLLTSGHCARVTNRHRVACAMTKSAEPDETFPIEELTPEEASRIIHSHRKVRYGTLHSS